MTEANDKNEIYIGVIDLVSVKFGNIDLPISNRKCRAIIAFLCLSPTYTASREVLADLLWSESDPDQARTALRQALSRLRGFLGEYAEKVICFGRNELSISRDQMISERDVILRNLAEANFISGLDREGGIERRFLAELDGLSAQFDAWLAVQRRLFSDEVIRSLEPSIVNPGPNRLGFARILSAMDPSNEAARRAEMEELALSGQQAAALRIYEELYRLLETDYDVEPSADTVALVADIKLGKLRASVHEQPPLPMASPTDRPALAISELKKLDKTPVSPLCTQFHNDLLSVLVRFREWRVVEGNASSGSVDYILESIEAISVGEKPRMQIKLKAAGTSQILWGEALELSYDNYVAQQWLIAQRFAAAIDRNLSSDRLRAASARVPSNVSVFDRWLKCNALMSKWHPDQDSDAVEALETIIEEDPNFAPAQVALAGIFTAGHLVSPGSGLKEDRLRRAQKLAANAVLLDPLEARCQCSAGWSHLMLKNYDVAEMHFLQAVELNPSNAGTLLSCAQGMAFCDKPEQAAELVTRSKEIQQIPLGNLAGYEVGVNFLAGNLEESVEAAVRARGALSNTEGWRAAALWELGRPTEAAQAAEAFREDVVPIWYGSEPPDDAALHSWFSESFPIRDNAARRTLTNGLSAALAFDYT